MNTDADSRLAAAAETLTDRFDGVVDADTVARYVADSYVALHRPRRRRRPRPCSPNSASPSTTRTRNLLADLTTSTGATHE
jgi:hypothetical protein